MNMSPRAMSLGEMAGKQISNVKNFPQSHCFIKFLPSFKLHNFIHNAMGPQRSKQEMYPGKLFC